MESIFTRDMLEKFEELDAMEEDELAKTSEAERDLLKGYHRFMGIKKDMDEIFIKQGEHMLQDNTVLFRNITAFRNFYDSVMVLINDKVLLVGDDNTVVLSDLYGPKNEGGDVSKSDATSSEKVEDTPSENVMHVDDFIKEYNIEFSDNVDSEIIDDSSEPSTVYTASNPPPKYQ